LRDPLVIRASHVVYSHAPGVGQTTSRDAASVLRSPDVVPGQMCPGATSPGCGLGMPRQGLSSPNYRIARPLPAKTRGAEDSFQSLLLASSAVRLLPHLVRAHVGPRTRPDDAPRRRRILFASSGTPDRRRPNVWHCLSTASLRTGHPTRSLCICSNNPVSRASGIRAQRARSC
jgi:hypothetical protein